MYKRQYFNFGNDHLRQLNVPCGFVLVGLIIVIIIIITTTMFMVLSS